MMSADAKDVKASDVHMQATVLRTVVRSVGWGVPLLKARLVAISIAVSVGLTSVVSPVTVVGIRRTSVAIVSVTVSTVMTMVNSVAAVMPVASFRGRCNETESDNQCRKCEKTLHGSVLGGRLRK
jgi:hypothetical protein